MPLDLDAEGGAVRNGHGQWTMTRREWKPFWCLCSEMQGTLSGVGRCDRGVSTFNGAFRSGLAPCGRDCRIVGKGKWKGSA